MDDNSEDALEAEENYYACLNISKSASVLIDYFFIDCNSTVEMMKFVLNRKKNREKKICYCPPEKRIKKKPLTLNERFNH